MKKLGFRFLLFVPLCVLGYLVFLNIWGHFFPKNLRPNLVSTEPIGAFFSNRIQELEAHQSIDILFLGPSTAARGLDPRYYTSVGLTAFNLASNNQTPLQTSILLQRYINHFNPKVVIYDVYPHMFEISGLESATEVIRNTKEDLLSAKMVWDIGAVSGINSFLFSFSNEVVGLTQPLTFTDTLGDITYIPGGFESQALKHATYESFEPKQFRFYPQQLRTFKENIRLLKSRGIRVILIQIPFTTWLYQQYANMPYIDSTMHSLGEYYNFNEILHLDDSLHFQDALHLNSYGVEKLNQKLIDTLQWNVVSPL